jgi:ribosomal protein L12E/L44/L45/RPP1/RPP2
MYTLHSFCTRQERRSMNPLFRQYFLPLVSLSLVASLDGVDIEDAISKAAAAPVAVAAAPAAGGAAPAAAAEEEAPAEDKKAEEESGMAGLGALFG